MPTIFASIESEGAWLAVALCWVTYVDVPLPGALRVISQPHCRVHMLSLN